MRTLLKIVGLIVNLIVFLIAWKAIGSFLSGLTEGTIHWWAIVTLIILVVLYIVFVLGCYSFAGKYPQK
jgi:hypothetical protein